MDTESEAGVTDELGSIQRQYDHRQASLNNNFLMNQRSPEGLNTVNMPSEYSQRSQAPGMREAADAGAFGMAMASAGVNNAETAQ